MQDVDRLVEELVLAFQPVILVHPMHHNQELPEWLVREIRRQRLIELVRREVHGETVEEVSDAEVVAYLYTASLAAPLRTEYARIYLHLARRLLGDRARDIDAPESLTDYELGLLRRLKRELYTARTRKERERLGFVRADRLLKERRKAVRVEG